MAPLVGIKLERALHEFLGGVVGQPFRWGELDCNTTALAWLDMLAGTDELGPVRGRYSTEAEAEAFQLEYGRTLRTVLQDAGAVLVSGGPRFAQPGDFILVGIEGAPWACGHVSTGWEFLSVDPGRGAQLLPMHQAPTAGELWRCAPCPR